MAVPWLGFVKPLVLRTRITVDGPDPIGSAAYAADFDEVKRLGSATSTERTAAQTATAKFFNANSVLQLRQALLDHLERNPLSLARTTRLFAALDAATADALIQVGGSSTTSASGGRSRPSRPPIPTGTMRRRPIPPGRP